MVSVYRELRGHLIRDARLGSRDVEEMGGWMTSRMLRLGLEIRDVPDSK